MRRIVLTLEAALLFVDETAALEAEDGDDETLPGALELEDFMLDTGALLDDTAEDEAAEERRLDDDLLEGIAEPEDAAAEDERQQGLDTAALETRLLILLTERGDDDETAKTLLEWSDSELNEEADEMILEADPFEVIALESALLSEAIDVADEEVPSSSLAIHSTSASPK